MTFNEDPFALPPSISRRSDVPGGLNLLADAVEKSSVPVGNANAASSSPKPPTFDDPRSDEDEPTSPSSSPPLKKRSKTPKPRGTTLKNPPTTEAVPVLSQEDDSKSRCAPKTPSKDKVARSATSSDDNDKIPIDSPEAIAERARIFETPRQFFSRMKKVLPRKECDKRELYSHPFPIDSETRKKFESIDCDSWSDSFCSPFHLSVELDPAIWVSLSSKFDAVSSLEEFQAFLEIH